MHLSRLFLGGLLLAAACSEPGALPLTAPETPGLTGPSYSFAEDRYPTADEIAANGGVSSLSVGPVTSGWHGDLKTMASTATTTVTWVNVASSKMTTELLNESGARVNGKVDAQASSQYRPEPSGTKFHYVETSTLNRICGTTGTVKVEASAEFKFLDANFEPRSYWKDATTKNGDDIVQPECIKEEEEEVGDESGDGCGDGEYCDGDGGGSGGEAGGGGSGGPTQTCTLWLFRGMESQDGGETWSEIYRYYMVIC